jgi:hypothetical protein
MSLMVQRPGQCRSLKLASVGDAINAHLAARRAAKRGPIDKADPESHSVAEIRTGRCFLNTLRHLTPHARTVYFFQAPSRRRSVSNCPRW